MPPVALAQSAFESLDGFFGEFDLVHELTAELVQVLPQQLSQQIHGAVAAYRERTSFEPTLLTSHGELDSDVEVVKETLAYMELSAPLHAIAKCLEVPDWIYVMDLSHDRKRVRCNVLEAGLVDWHSDRGVNHHARRLLIPITDLPLQLHVDDSYASDSVIDASPTRRVPLSEENGQLKAIFLDGNLPHRVVLDDTASIDSLEGQPAVMYLDIPLSSQDDTLPSLLAAS